MGIKEELKKTEETIKKISLSRESFDIMGVDETTFETIMRDLSNKQRTLKIEYAKQKHVTKDGKPRMVTPNGKYFKTYLPDKTTVRAKTVDEVYLKLYDYYSEDGNYITDFSVQNIYSLAIDAKKKAKGVSNNKADISKSNTILRLTQDYNRFITPEFAKMDTQSITQNKLYDYIIDELNDIYSKTGKKLSHKSFNDHFKRILNLIFDYAADHDILEYNFLRKSNKFASTNFSDLLDYGKKDAKEKAFSEEEIKTMADEIQKRIEMWFGKGKIYTTGYMFILATVTGLRIGELCSLKKEDVNFNEKYIHVHAQQLEEKDGDGFGYVDHTKNEKNGSLGGRYVPLTDNVCELLQELFEKQQQFGIKSEWVFCNENGDWIRHTQYSQFLRRLSKKFGYGITNNHAIRMYFNSYKLVPLGVEAPERAKMLGHSIEVNLKHYSFADRDYCEKIRQKLNKIG